jgi:hypothetical protein
VSCDNLSDFEAGPNTRATIEADLERSRSGCRRILVAHILHGKRSVIVLDGWTPAGRAGRSRRLIANWTHAFLRSGRSRARRRGERAPLPLALLDEAAPRGEIAVFDRSWYGRVLVERVEGFAPRAQWRRGYDEINEFEAQQADDGTTIVKLFFHVTQETQDERLKARVEHPVEALESHGEDFRNGPARRLCRRDQGHVRSHQHALGALARDRRQQQEVGAYRGAEAIADALERAVPMKPLPLDPEIEALAPGIWKRW